MVCLAYPTLHVGSTPSIPGGAAYVAHSEVVAATVVATTALISCCAFNYSVSQKRSSAIADKPRDAVL